MNDKNTPIPLRASRKPPKPLPLPTIRNDSNITPITDMPFTRAEVLDLLKEHDMRLARTLHKVVMDWPIAEIMCMGESEFVALFRSVLEDAE